MKQSSNSSGSKETLPIAIVGAGVSGLYTSYLLHEAGVKNVIIEARDRIGGRVVSKQIVPSRKSEPSGEGGSGTKNARTEKMEEEEDEGEGEEEEMKKTQRVRAQNNEKKLHHSERYDLGPSWFWPRSHKRMVAAIKKFGLKAFDQYDSGAYAMDMVLDLPLSLHVLNALSSERRIFAR
mmetsp:Transcript_8404/g.13595  ORF Transcript_8404/g.13595 Transcript_8404/m.13595 type:complete len:179 (-) Transcript_8404:164-700(-)